MALPIKQLLRFSLPIILGQLGIMLIGAGDVLVAGRFSTQTLAAIGVANGFQGPIIMLGVGLMMGIAPVLSQLRGEGHQSHKELKVVLAYSLLTSALLVIINYSLIPTIGLFGIDDSLLSFVKRYLFLTGFSLPGIMIYQGLKEYLQSQEKTLVANGLSLAAVIINILGNYLLVFGHRQFAAIGEDGLAYMSIITRFFLGTSLFFYALPSLKSSHPACKKIFNRIVRLSFPISLSVLAEVFAFSFVSILVGSMGTEQAATHNIILTIASISFMIPLSISSAASVKVGHSFGKRDIPKIGHYSMSAIIISSGFMTCSAIVFLTIPKPIMLFFTEDLKVVELGIKMLMVVAFFQLFDGLQITLAGILRGLSISRSVLLATLFSHWIVGFPFGRYLAYQKNLLALGLWMGLALGLFLLSGVLLILLYHRFKNLKEFVARQPGQ